MIMGMGIPWEWEMMAHNWEWEWEGMGITLADGNESGPYSHGNKFPSADAVFSICNTHSLRHTDTHSLHNND